MNRPHPRLEDTIPVCPSCGKYVFANGKGWLAPVKWEGGIDTGHSGCLNDLFHARERDDVWEDVQDTRALDDYEGGRRSQAEQASTEGYD